MMEPKDFWRAEWGSTYPGEAKMEVLPKWMSRVESEGKIGPIVVDIGSGFHPVSEFLKKKHKVVSIDFGGDHPGNEDRMHIDIDVGDIDKKWPAKQRAQMVKIAEFLGISPKEQNTSRVDTVVFSEILNYVDFASVLEVFAKYLKPGGTFIIVNKPNWGPGKERRFHIRRLKNNRDLYAWLQSHDFVIEEKAYAGRAPSEIHPNLVADPEAEAYILLVARKKQH